MSDQDAVLFANEAFYAAFADRDIEAMEQLWSKTLPLSCTHPGWQALIGADAVMESWAEILSNVEAPRVACCAQQATIHGDVAVVNCVEELTVRNHEPEYLSATNVFVRVGRVWTMVHHHAGPIHAELEFPDAEDEAPRSIN